MTAPRETRAPTTIAPVRQVPLGRPLHWLALGWRDFTRAPLASGLHGVLVALGGLAILFVTLRLWYLLPGALSGFVLVGPILATGLYELSRRMERNQLATLADVIAAWRRGTRPLVWMGLLLMLAATLWVMFTAVLLAISVEGPITGLDSLLRKLILDDESWLFPEWLLLGGIGAALVFAATAVSLPMLLERDVDLPAAVLTSVRAVGENPYAMAFWSALIMVATALSMATAMLGFIVVYPVIGHATWHCYRDLVDADRLPLRD
ncbi:MAG TPA: DUF2189 domain-containing protein [Burkholderiales bacterium]|nr:DUF2189 domain-containing protein [Burkholderiales bacterium]